MATAALQKRNYAKSIRTYMVMIAVATALAGYYGITQYLKLSGAQEALAKEQIQITETKNAVSQSNTDFTNLQQDFNQKYADVLNSLQTIYPNAEDYTKLAIDLENYFRNSNTSFNPIFLSDLKFGQARYEAATEYAVLPVTMTINGTYDNFMKFLKYIENSGVFDADTKRLTRLMDVRSISINFISNQENSVGFPGQLTSTQPMLNVSISLNAYFQKPLVTKTTTTSTTSTPKTSASS